MPNSERIHDVLSPGTDAVVDSVDEVEDEFAVADADDGSARSPAIECLNA